MIRCRCGNQAFYHDLCNDCREIQLGMVLLSPATIAARDERSDSWMWERERKHDTPTTLQLIELAQAKEQQE